MKHPPSELTHPQVRRIILGIMLAMFLGALDQTIVATALPTIGAQFNDFANLPWVVTAYLLAATVATPLYGKLSDIRGRRVMLLISVAVFSLASLACALAPNLLMLILARAVQGLGGGGLISLAQTIIADVVAPRERPRYQAQIAAVFAAASILGPVLGGFFAQHLDWTLIFWINLPMGAAAYLMTDRTLRRLPRHDRRHDLDGPGAALMAFAALALLLALNWGGVRFAWGSPQIVGLIAASLVLAGLFVWRIRTAPEPFISLDMLTDPVVGRAIPAAFAAAGTMVGLSIFVPLYFETVRGLSASQSGLALIPLMGGIVCGAVTSGRLLARLTHYKRPGVIGNAVSALLLAAFALSPVPLPLPLPLLVAGLAVVGMGIGTVLPMTTISIQNAVVPHRMGTATGLMNFFRQLGGAMVVAVLGAVLLGFAGSAAGHDVGELARHASADALTGGFAYVFGTAALVLLAGLGFLVAMEERPLRTSVRAAAEEAAGIGE
ncbi:MDR family MFS transporter [Xanthobacter sp. KR7-225]|uniref:MDR family MFS transporter n=1 Tax=Xanthobacter sp. KR7-225 TaxID=3156613 RepID=UPI0032B32059